MPWLRNYAFRLWTAAAVLAAYAYAWVERPEYLTWWKRATNRTIEWGCGLLPYPWGDRIEATLGNFGLWVQITLAILLFRVIAGLAIRLARRSWPRRRRPRPAPAQAGYAAEPPPVRPRAPARSRRPSA